jgi:zinc protease
MTKIPANANTLPGPDDITRAVLGNGITLLARPNFNSPSVVITGYLANGSLFDPDEKLGLAHFTALALMRGTQTHDFQQIYDALESAGASLGFGAGLHTTSFSGRALAEDLPLLLGLLSESMRLPIFPPDQVERLRIQLLTGLAIRAQDTGDMASLAFDRMVYANHPYARPEDGYTETVQAISQPDLVQYHQKHFGPRSLVLVVVGGVSPQQAIDQVQQALGDWKNPAQPDLPALPDLQPLQETVTQQVVIAGKSQADLVMGSQGPTRRSSDYMAASLGNNVLGQFGMMGRIGDVVREQSGLAYYAYTSLNSGQGPGSWEVSAGVNPTNVQKAIDLIRSEIGHFVHELVSPEELADSQANYIGRLPLALESNNGMASSLLNLERFELGLDYYRRYPDMVRAVTREDVLEVARRYLDPAKLAIAVAGPVIEPVSSAA